MQHAIQLNHGEFVHTITLSKYQDLVARLIPEICKVNIDDDVSVFGNFTSIDNSRGKVCWVVTKSALPNRREILLEYSYYSEELTMQIAVSSVHSVLMNGNVHAAGTGFHEHETVQINFGPSSLRESNDAWVTMDSITSHPTPIGDDSANYVELFFKPKENPNAYKSN